MGQLNKINTMETIAIKNHILNTIKTKPYIKYYDLFSTIQYRLQDEHNERRFNGTIDELILETLNLIDGALVNDSMSEVFRKIDQNTLIDLFLSFYDYINHNRRVFSKLKSVFGTLKKYESINNCSISDFQILFNPFMTGYNVFMRGLLLNDELSLEELNTFESKVKIYDHGIHHTIAKFGYEYNHSLHDFVKEGSPEDVILYGKLLYDEDSGINTINVLRPLLKINELLANE